MKRPLHAMAVEVLHTALGGAALDSAHNFHTILIYVEQFVKRFSHRAQWLRGRRRALCCLGPPWWIFAQPVPPRLRTVIGRRVALGSAVARSRGSYVRFVEHEKQNGTGGAQGACLFFK